MNKANFTFKSEWHRAKPRWTAAWLVAAGAVGLTGAAIAADNESELASGITAANDSESVDNGGENNDVRTINITGDFSIAGSLPTATQSLSLRGDGFTVDSGTLNVVDGESLRLGEGFTWDGDLFLSGAGSQLILESGAVVTTANGNTDATLTLDYDMDQTIGAGFWDPFDDFSAIRFIGDSESTLTSAITLDADIEIANGSLLLGADNLLALDQGFSISSGADVDLAGFSQSIGSLSGSGDLDLGLDATTLLTIGGNDANATFSGTIVGDGGITKVGTGTQTFSGTLEYAGDTRVSDGQLTINGSLENSNVIIEDGGTLVINDSSQSDSTFNIEQDLLVESGGTLFGTGSVGGNLTNDGTIGLSEDGALDRIRIVGDYTQSAGAEFLFEVNSNGTAGALEVEGIATLAGVLDLSTTNEEENFGPATSYTLLTAEGGIIGEWDTIIEDFAFLDAEVEYRERDDADGDGDEAVLNLVRNDLEFSDIANTGNQQNVASALTTVLASAEDELSDVIATITGLDDDGARAAYDSLAGATAATVGGTTVASSGAQNAFLIDQLAGGTPVMTRFASLSQEQASELTFFSSQSNEPSGWSPLQVEQVRQDTSPEEIASTRVTPWFAIYTGTGDLDSSDTSGLDYDRWGGVLGLDFIADGSDVHYGITLGIEQSDLTYNNNAGTNDVESLYIGFYTQQPFGQYRFTGIVSIGAHQHDSTRNIVVGATSGVAFADYNSYSISLLAELSYPWLLSYAAYPYDKHPQSMIEPFIRLGYSASLQDGYTESGVGTAGLDVDSEVFDSIRAGIGVRGEYRFNNPYAMSLRGRVLIDAPLTDETASLNVAFVDTPGSNFIIEGAEQDAVSAVFGIGIYVPLDSNSSLFVDFDQRLSSDGGASVLSGGLRYEF